MQKKTLLVALLLALVASFLLAGPVVTAAPGVPGPFVDKIYVNTRTNTEIGAKDTAEGLTDVFYWGMYGSEFMALPPETRAKLETYEVPSGSWSFLFNPYPNKAPYIADVGGVEYFNPFAIREIRFAMNFLLNRQYVVDEILAGAGMPAFTMATQGQPGTYKYNLLADEFGFTPEGNEALALKEIETAMQAAAALPANQGRLVKTGGKWMFDGKPVTLNFLIRVDDPSGRLRLGNYFADQVEKSGITVNRLAWDRVKCATLAYYSDPKAAIEIGNIWHLYTEGWGAGATRAFWEHIVAQMYAPWYGYMPGGAEPSNWNYENALIDDMTLKAYTGNFMTEDEYWNYALTGLKEGLREAVRIYVANQTDFFVANKARFAQRFAYGLGDGLNEWSLITAKTVDKKLTVTQFSARGALFMASWNPVGADGFNDVYSNNIAGPLYDPGSFESPVSAISTPKRTLFRLDSLESKVQSVGAGEDVKFVGLIDVPPSAIKYDAVSNSWKPVGDGVKAFSKCTYDFVYGKWHDGTPQTLADLMYMQGFVEEWISKDGPEDKEFDDAYSSKLKPGNDTLKGWVLNADGSITTYFDYNFPPSAPRVAANGAPGWTVSASGHAVGVAWSIYEALARMVADGGTQSGTTWSFSSQAENEVDVLVPRCVADIRAKLQELYDKGHVPQYVVGYMTQKEAKDAYANAIKFIDKYGHAYISNGPFWLEKYDPISNFMELTANRDPSYPYSSQYWTEVFAVPTISIDRITIPSLVPAGKNLEVVVRVSKVVYPEVLAENAEEGRVTVRFLSSPEIVVQANLVRSGEFKAIIPGTSLVNVPKGTYKVQIEAQLEGALEKSETKNVVIW